MAQIDLKNCDVYIKDGYATNNTLGSPAVNNMAGYSSGATTMLVDGVTGAFAVGDIFIVAADTTGLLHTITAHTETLSNTTSITFTPALGHAVLDNGIITVQAHQIRVRVGDGNVEWTEKRPVIYVKDRGLLDTVRLGDQEPLEVKFDATWVFLTASGSEPATIKDALKKTGPASTWVSSSADQCEPYAVTIEIVYTPPCSTTGEVYFLHDFRYEDIGNNLKQGMLAFTGKCNAISSTDVRQTGE